MAYRRRTSFGKKKRARGRRVIKKRTRRNARRLRRAAPGETYTTIESWTGPTIAMLADGSETLTGILRADPGDSARVTAIAANFKRYKIAWLKCQLKPMFAPESLYNVNSEDHALNAVTYLDTDGLNVAASTMDTALKAPYPRRHPLMKPITRIFKSPAFQTMSLQNSVSTSTSTPIPINPWLNTTTTGLSVDRVGMGFFVPSMIRNNPTPATATLPEFRWQQVWTMKIMFKHRQ